MIVSLTNSIISINICCIFEQNTCARFEKYSSTLDISRSLIRIFAQYTIKYEETYFITANYDVLAIYR